MAQDPGKAIRLLAYGVDTPQKANDLEDLYDQLADSALNFKELLKKHNVSVELLTRYENHYQLIDKILDRQREQDYHSLGMATELIECGKFLTSVGVPVDPEDELGIYSRITSLFQ